MRIQSEFDLDEELEVITRAPRKGRFNPRHDRSHLKARRAAMALLSSGRS